MSTAGRCTWTILAALILAAVPLSRVHAQQNAPSDPADGARAAALRAQATAIFSDRSRYGEAAQLLQHSSALTPVEDPARADDLRLAANLLYYTGAVNEAQDVMVQAAEAALARGDVATAADAFVDAAWLAALHHGNAQARELVYRALHLAASPYLTNDQREAIRKRVAQAGLEGVKVSNTGADLRTTGWPVASDQAVPRGESMAR